jgi:hypothetical protein
MLPKKYFVGTISKSRWKVDLIDIANGLGIANTGTISELVSCIKETFKLIKSLQLIQSFRSCSCIGQELQEARNLRVKERIVLKKMQKMLLRMPNHPYLQLGR